MTDATSGAGTAYTSLVHYRSLVFCVVFCTLFFVPLSFFLFGHCIVYPSIYGVLLKPLVSSNCSFVLHLGPVLILSNQLLFIGSRAGVFYHRLFKYTQQHIAGFAENSNWALHLPRPSLCVGIRSVHPPIPIRANKLNGKLVNLLIRGFWVFSLNNRFCTKHTF